MLSEIKSGIWYLTRDFPDVPVVPVYLHGLGRAMGRGQWSLVPFFVDIAVGRPLQWLEESRFPRPHPRIAIAFEAKRCPPRRRSRRRKEPEHAPSRRIAVCQL